jgi:hypothetical protein
MAEGIAVQVVVHPEHTIHVVATSDGWHYDPAPPHIAGVYVYRLHDPKTQHWHEAMWYVGDSGDIAVRLDKHQKAEPGAEGTSCRVNAGVRRFLENHDFAEVDIFTSANVETRGYGKKSREPNVGLHNGFTRRLTESALLVAFTTMSGFTEEWGKDTAINDPIRPKLTVLPPDDEDFEIVIEAAHERAEVPEDDDSPSPLDELEEEYEAALRAVRSHP